MAKSGVYRERANSVFKIVCLFYRFENSAILKRLRRCNRKKISTSKVRRPQFISRPLHVTVYVTTAGGGRWQWGGPRRQEMLGTTDAGPGHARLGGRGASAHPRRRRGGLEELEIRKADFTKSMFAAQTGLLTHDLSNHFYQDEDSKVLSGA